MFVGEKPGDDDDAEPGGPGKHKAQRQPEKKSNSADMHDAGDEQSVGDAEAPRHGEKTCVLVEVYILTGVKDVEAAHPQSDCGAEYEHAQVEMAGDGDPGGGGRDTEREAEK